MSRQLDDERQRRWAKKMKRRLNDLHDRCGPSACMYVVQHAVSFQCRDPRWDTWENMFRTQPWGDKRRMMQRYHSFLKAWKHVEHKQAAMLKLSWSALLTVGTSCVPLVDHWETSTEEWHGCGVVTAVEGSDYHDYQDQTFVWVDAFAAVFFEPRLSVDPNDNTRVQQAKHAYLANRLVDFLPTWRAFCVPVIVARSNQRSAATAGDALPPAVRSFGLHRLLDVHVLLEVIRDFVM